ncbi:MAG: PhnD/SsuA/transferrin family substrate-binding protein, partial [Myxococcus sp.]|nr:PhnD/SsuA/transferrin family substrate-binding protein [Myxococcus sp.]
QQHKLDRRSDVFALGIVAWELFTSRRLFKRETDLETMNAIIKADAWAPSDFRDELPPAVAEVVMKALAASPADRHPTADAFRKALLAAADAAGLKHGLDELAGFVTELLGDTLRANELEVKSAVERAKREGFVDEDRTRLDGPAHPPTNSETLPRASMSRRVSNRTGLTVREVRLALGLALVALAVGAGVAYRLKRPPLTGPELRVGWPPTVDTAVLENDVEPLRVHLERALGRPVTFVFATSYHALASDLLEGGVRYASLPPVLFVRTEQRSPQVHVVAVKLIGGSSGTDGVLLAAEGSGIGSVADLKGKTLCVPDEDSTTGMLFPRLAVRKAGLDWAQDITVVKSGNHLQVLRDLAERRCQAGGTYSGAFVNAVTQGVNVASLRQIAITGRSPQDAIVAGPGVPAEERAQLEAALFSYRPPERSGATMETITGFVAPKPEDYASLRELVALEDQPAPPR